MAVACRITGRLHMANDPSRDTRRWRGSAGGGRAATPVAGPDYRQRAQALRDMEARAAEALAAQRRRVAERKLQPARQQAATRQALRAAAAADRRTVLAALGFALALTAGTAALNVVAPDPKYGLMVQVLCGVTGLAGAIWLAMRIDHLLRYRRLPSE